MFKHLYSSHLGQSGEERMLRICQVTSSQYNIGLWQTDGKTVFVNKYNKYGTYA